MKNTAEDHFDSKKLHTEIKHKLFESALSTCIKISNGMNYNAPTKIPFLYIDLFAGSGKFKDEKEGSPLIALNAISKYKNFNNFSKFDVIVTEQNSNNSKKLQENISKKILELDIKGMVDIEIKNKNWEACAKELQERTSKRKYGFIFVDPFALELNINNLVSIVENKLGFKDILILVNKSAHERTFGCDDNGALQKIANYFGVSLKQVKRLQHFIRNENNIDNETVIQYLLIKSLERLNKDFIINVAITGTKKGKLENADRFYLCLMTSSIGVANSFLDTYASIINDKIQTNSGGQTSLFSSNEDVKYFELENRLREILTTKNITLFKLVSILFNDFYSWKSATPEQIPKTNNLCKALNSLIKDNVIKIEYDSDLDSKCINLQKQILKSDAFKYKKCMKKIRIHKI